GREGSAWTGAGAAEPTLSESFSCTGSDLAEWRASRKGKGIGLTRKRRRADQHSGMPRTLTQGGGGVKMQRMLRFSGEPAARTRAAGDAMREGSECALDHLRNLVLADRANLRGLYLPILDEQQGRNAAHA